MPRHRALRAGLGVALALVPMAALAGSVYLNNVNIDGVTNQKFEKATVRLDEKGNVFIDAPGYAASVVPTPTPTPAPPSAAPAAVPSAAEPARLTQRYFLVTEQTATGMTDFDIDLYLNSKWIRRLKNNEEQIITEVTKFLTPGKNTALLVARKNVSGPRKSFSPTHVFRVIIGTGNVGGDNVMIDQPVARFQRTAAEEKDISEEFTFTTR